MNFLTREEERELYTTVIELRSEVKTFGARVEQILTCGCKRGEEDRKAVQDLVGRVSALSAEMPNGNGGKRTTVWATLAGGSIAGALMAAKSVIEWWIKGPPPPGGTP